MVVCRGAFWDGASRCRADLALDTGPVEDMEDDFKTLHATDLLLVMLRRVWTWDMFVVLVPPTLMKPRSK